MCDNWYHHWVVGVTLNDQLWHQALVMDHVLESLWGSEQGPNDAMMWTLLRQGVIDADSVNKEQDKFFRRVNRQRANIDALRERMERLELRARALELENESLSAHLDSMVDKLCFCTQAEVTSQVVGSEPSN